MSANCFCSNPINPCSAQSAIWEENYCSKYCREFDSRGLETIKGDIKTGLKQMSGLRYMPKIEISCDYCGDGFDLSSGRGATSNANFCSRDCFLKISKLNIQKSFLHYNMIKVLLHHRKFKDGWLSVSALNEIMARSRNFKSNTRRLSQLLRLWVSRGLIDKKQINTRVTEYRLNEIGINNPIGKVFVDLIPKKVVN